MIEAGALAAAVAIAIITWPAQQTTTVPPAIASAQVVTGTVSAPPRITAGSRVRTGNNSLAAFDWNGHGSLRVAPNTSLTFISDNAIHLDRGAIYFASEKGGTPVTVRTPRGEVRDVGTQFEVRVNREEVRVRVREGRADLGARAVNAGNELTASANGMAQRPIARSGAEWAWVISAAPPLRVEGELRPLLEAIAREKGLTLRMTQGTSSVLHSGLSLQPDEALTAAVAASGLTYRIEGDALVVGR